jgi:hypothetical protein
MNLPSTASSRCAPISLFSKDERVLEGNLGGLYDLLRDAVQTKG